MIDKDKMVDIMTDIYLLEAYIRITSNERPEIRDSVDYLYTWLFNNHEITREAFHEAFECYSLDRELMEHLNEEVLNAISIIETRTPADGKTPKEDDATIDDKP